MVTLPVAAHSVPRSITVRKPMQRIAVMSSPMACPITVVKTRPLPKGMTQIIGSLVPVPPLALSE